jgi:hypothetical protein
VRTQIARSRAGRSSGWRELGLVLASLICGSCFNPFVVGDGYLGVTGYVYESASPEVGRGGSVVIDSETSAASHILRPIAGCDVTLEPWTPRRRPNADTAKLFTIRGRSDAKGQFVLGRTAPPGRYDATISISCDGFVPNTRVFRHDRLKHSATVMMVRGASGVTNAPQAPPQPARELLQGKNEAQAGVHIVKQRTGDVADTLSEEISVESYSR